MKGRSFKDRIQVLSLSVFLLFGLVNFFLALIGLIKGFWTILLSIYGPWIIGSLTFTFDAKEVPKEYLEIF